MNSLFSFQDLGLIGQVKNDQFVRFYPIRQSIIIFFLLFVHRRIYERQTEGNNEELTHFLRINHGAVGYYAIFLVICPHTRLSRIFYVNTREVALLHTPSSFLQRFRLQFETINSSSVKYRESPGQPKNDALRDHLGYLRQGSHAQPQFLKLEFCCPNSDS